MPACPYCEKKSTKEVLPRRKAALYQCENSACRLRFSTDEAPKTKKTKGN